MVYVSGEFGRAGFLRVVVEGNMSVGKRAEICEIVFVDFAYCSE